VDPCRLLPHLLIFYGLHRSLCACPFSAPCRHPTERELFSVECPLAGPFLMAIPRSDCLLIHSARSSSGALSTPIKYVCFFDTPWPSSKCTPAYSFKERHTFACGYRPSMNRFKSTLNRTRNHAPSYCFFFSAHKSSATFSFIFC